MVGQLDARGTAACLVAEARGKRGLSQRELARAAGVPQSTVTMIESGKRQPSVAMLERVLDAAGFHLRTRLVNTVRPSRLLAEHGEDVAHILARYPILQTWVFGSVARNEDRADSDLDLLVEIAPQASFVDIVGLDEELSETLGCPVDVITTRELESNDLFRRGVYRHRRKLTDAA